MKNTVPDSVKAQIAKLEEEDKALGADVLVPDKDILEQLKDIIGADDC